MRWSTEAGNACVLRTHASGGDFIAEFEHEADSKRARDCVNACEDIFDPSAIPELIACLRELMTGHSMRGEERARQAIDRAMGVTHVSE